MTKTITLELHDVSEKPPKAGYYLVWNKNSTVVECYCRYHKFEPLGVYPDYIKQKIRDGDYKYWSVSPDLKKLEEK